MITAKRNPNKWCDFHDDHGHLTEECIQLKDNIEDLIRQGYLAKYLTDHREEKKAKEIPKSTPQIQAKNTLPAVPTMSFLAEDCRGITYDHEDPLVVSVDIANHMVHRVLVDGGSSANILFRCAFDKLKIDPRQLAKVNFPVIGFNGSSVIPDGKITLPVTIERRQTTRNNLTEFLVVDVPTVYNVIMGRPLIHKVKGVTSTYHQMMLYVSDAGTPEKLRGNQESARRCNYNAVKTRNRRDFDLEENSPEEKSDLQEASGGIKRKSDDVESNRSTLMTDMRADPTMGRPRRTPRWRISPLKKEETHQASE
ncbi:uncharacterized protein [Spinacia oleracea]|uniref:Retrotransposon gag domain-containing protein n=1 Tax=Spinacia oleracea TaxID=3562 RepID=A0ABM3RH24_SPIOL|nr:uncharacterized protein LOC130469570 [Spinacia oleracea]